jgi:hypothetical protein
VWRIDKPTFPKASTHAGLDSGWSALGIDSIWRGRSLAYRANHGLSQRGFLRRGVPRSHLSPHSCAAIKFDLSSGRCLASGASRAASRDARGRRSAAHGSPATPLDGRTEVARRSRSARNA